MRYPVIALATVIAFVLAGSAEPANRIVQLLSNEDNGALRALIPDSADGRLQQFRADPRTLVYTEAVMPRCYQEWMLRAIHGVHDAYHNIVTKADAPDELFGNANREFPWDGPAGTHKNDGSTTFKFMRLPAGQQITLRRKVFPGVAYAYPVPENERRRGVAGDDPASGGTYVWEFPLGTEFGEVLLATNPATKQRKAWEARTRTKTATGWAPQVYRPYIRPDQLQNMAGQLAIDDPELMALPELILALGKPKLAPHRLVNKHPAKSVDLAAWQEQLPALPPDIVDKLLERTFLPASGTVWRTDKPHVSYGPTTESAYHIIPKGYTGYLIETSKDSCMNCHRDTLKTAHEIQTPRDWYGRIRGSDNIFTWHPFDPKSVTTGADLQANGRANPVTLRPAFVDAGWIRVIQ